MKEIRRLRKCAGLSVKALSSITGVSAMSIYRYEQGKRKPDVEVAAKIASALGCSIESLIGQKKAG